MFNVLVKKKILAQHYYASTAISSCLSGRFELQIGPGILPIVKSQASGGQIRVNRELGTFALKDTPKGETGKQKMSQEIMYFFISVTLPLSLTLTAPHQHRTALLTLSPVCRSSFIPPPPLFFSCLSVSSSFSFFSADNQIGLGQEFVIPVILLPPHKSENPLSAEQYIKWYIYIYINPEKTMRETYDH